MLEAGPFVGIFVFLGLVLETGFLVGGWPLSETGFVSLPSFS